MFDFFKEVIINSDTLPIEEGRDAKGQAFKRFYALTPETSAEEIGSDASHYRAPKEGIFRVLRCADYVKSGVKGPKVYKTVGRKGKVAEVTFNLNPLVGKVGQYRILVDISLEGRYYSDYKYPWSEFHKPIMAEFEVTSDMTLVTDIVSAAIKSLKLYIPSDYKFAVAVGEDGELKIIMSDPYQIVKAAKIQKVVEDGCLEGCSGVKYEDTIASTITKNISPFGTGEWLTENLRFPTYPNLRYAGVNDDEKPISGALYTQFAFEYASPRRGLHGQGTVGQALVSVTHHVFYVLNELVSEFETEIKKAFGDVIVSISPELTILNAGKEFAGPMIVSEADVNAGTVALQATYSDPSFTGNVSPVWSVTSPFKIEESSDQATLGKLDDEVSAGATGTLTATYKDASTTVKVVVE